MSTVEQVNFYSAPTLANRADVAMRGDSGSAGAEFLTHIRDAVLEEITSHLGVHIGITIATAAEMIDDDDIYQLADNAPDIYTTQRWAEFVDLSAWNEDLSDLGQPDNMTDAAGVALVLIAERLIRALLAELIEEVS